VPKLKLTYFDFHGGRGEPARLALSMAGIPFEDDRVSPSDWERRKPDTPFGALPVLEVDGQTLAQSNAINRYVGKLADLYPTDAWQAALCDEEMEAVEDISTKLAATLFPSDEEKKAQRKVLVDGPIAFYLTRLEQRLEAHGGRYFGANRLTVGDLKAFVWIRHLKSGVLDHIPADLPDRVAPKLVEHYERVKNDPRIQAYYAKHGVTARTPDLKRPQD
jgi:glutathione S-transferase